jgi:hypothetical protein
MSPSTDDDTRKYWPLGCIPSFITSFTAHRRGANLAPGSNLNTIWPSQKPRGNVGEIPSWTMLHTGTERIRGPIPSARPPLGRRYMARSLSTNREDRSLLEIASSSVAQCVRVLRAQIRRSVCPPPSRPFAGAYETELLEGRPAYRLSPGISSPSSRATLASESLRNLSPSLGRPAGATRFVTVSGWGIVFSD